MPVINGTSATVQNGMTAIGGKNHPGRIQLSTGSTSTGRSALSQQSSPQHFLVGGGVIKVGMILTPYLNLSDATNRYVIRAGLTNGALSAASSHWIGFRYTDDVNGGRWEAVTRDSSVETATDTGVTAEIDVFHRFEFEINADGTSVEFFIDGTLVATNTTNIPTTTVIGFMPVGIFKTVGTTARIAQIDAYWMSMEFTTPR